MHILNGITLLLVYQLIGELSVILLRLSVPGPVLGMALLFVSLLLWKRLPESMNAASSALLGHLSLLFVPAGVGVMVYFDRIAGEWLPIAGALLLSTLITMTATVFVMLASTRFLSRTRDD